MEIFKYQNNRGRNVFEKNIWMLNIYIHTHTCILFAIRIEDTITIYFEKYNHYTEMKNSNDIWKLTNEKWHFYLHVFLKNTNKIY